MNQRYDTSVAEPPAVGGVAHQIEYFESMSSVQLAQYLKDNPRDELAIEAVLDDNRMGRKALVITQLKELGAGRLLVDRVSRGL